MENENNKETYEVEVVDNEVVDDVIEKDYNLAIGIGVGVIGTILAKKGIDKLKGFLRKKMVEKDDSKVFVNADKVTVVDSSDDEEIEEEDKK